MNRDTDSHLAHNYASLPVTITAGQGAWVTDLTGRRLLDLLSAYSALNFGHGHPDLVAAARQQLEKLTLTSRAFGNDRLIEFSTALARLCGKDLVLPMNTGAEAVESGIKVARAWGYRTKQVPPGQALVVVASGNFHGRTTTIISFSDDPTARNDFGPYTPGFVSVPFGDAAAIEAVLTGERGADVVAVLVEPIQGEAGVVLPPPGYLRRVRQLTADQGVLFIADEIQSGLGRVGTTFACDREQVVPDLYLLGKALGGGIVPVSAVVGDEAVLGVLRPGEHGSTFGGNPLACAVGIAVIELLASGEPQAWARDLEPVLLAGLEPLVGAGVTGIRVAGAWAGVDIDPSLGTGREVALDLLQRDILVKDTHDQTIRIAPPLVIDPADLTWALTELAAILAARGAPSAP